MDMDGMMLTMGRKGNKKKKGIWERCKSIGRGGGGERNSSWNTSWLIRRSKSWPGLLRVPPEKEKRAAKGYLSVYVGPEMQRFMMKTEYANHPLFKMLLEEAESEYGYNSQGPLVLPCEVHIFYKVFMEMKNSAADPDHHDDDLDHDHHHQQPACTAFRNRSRSYHLLSPSPTISHISSHLISSSPTM